MNAADKRKAARRRGADRKRDAFQRGKVWRLTFAFVSRDRATLFPPMGPADRKDGDAWADLIAGWLQEAWQEGAALEVSNPHAQHQPDRPGVRPSETAE